MLLGTLCWQAAAWLLKWASCVSCRHRFADGIVQCRDKVQATIDILLVAGKTNTPEFGAGSQTFNKLFGTTVNPWDTSKTTGGSSGGSAAALAVGQVGLAASLEQR
jgi:Asp-tRNA(Asn)/Glu-tRNA(Gln) amidotransferase A subunit family amidase